MPRLREPGAPETDVSLRSCDIDLRARGDQVVRGSILLVQIVPAHTLLEDQRAGCKEPRWILTWFPRLYSEQDSRLVTPCLHVIFRASDVPLSNTPTH